MFYDYSRKENFNMPSTIRIGDVWFYKTESCSSYVLEEIYEVEHWSHCNLLAPAPLLNAIGLSCQVHIINIVFYPSPYFFWLLVSFGMPLYYDYVFAFIFFSSEMLTNIELGKEFGTLGVSSCQHWITVTVRCFPIILTWDARER